MSRIMQQNKRSYSIFSKEDIEVICLNEVKNLKEQPISTPTSLRWQLALTVIMALLSYWRKALLKQKEPGEKMIAMDEL